MDSEEKESLDNWEDHFDSLLNTGHSSSKKYNFKTIFNHLEDVLGCSFTFPGDIPSSMPKEEIIDRVCRKSQIYYKTIPLATLLTQSCPFPLLGFFKENQHPVLFRIKKGKCFEVLNQKEKVPVSSHLLEPIVYLFFRPLSKETSFSFFKIAKDILHHYSQDSRIVFVTGFFASLFSLMFPLSISLLFGTVLPSGSFPLLFQLFLALFLIMLSSCIFNIVQGYTLSRLRTFAIYDVQLGIWGNLFRTSSNILKKWSVGEIFEKVNYFSRSQMQLSEQIISGLISSLFSFVYFIALFYFSFSLALLSLGILVILFPILTVITLSFLKFQKEFLFFNNRLLSKVVQYIRGIRNIRTSNTQSLFFSSWAQAFIPTQKLIKKAGKMRAIFTTISQNTPTLITFVVYLVLILSYSHSVSIGTYIAFLSTLNMFIQSTYSAFNYFYDFIALIPSWNQAKEIAVLPAESSIVAPLKIPLQGKIQLKNICFSYDSKKPLLEKVDLIVNPGEFIGVVGPTGSGKSTLFRLLLGLETPEKGTIKYDDIDLKDWDLIDLRSQIGSVLQNNTVFEGNLLENITLGRKFEKKEIENVLIYSDLVNFIETLPMGLQTLVSYGGSNISLGQKQRILIARALFNRPKLLLLDEATSALDVFSQKKIFSQITSLGITVLAITHRQETLHFTHRIFHLGESKQAK